MPPARASPPARSGRTRSTTSPSLTGVPVPMMRRICSGPPIAGATRPTERIGTQLAGRVDDDRHVALQTRAVGMRSPSVWTPCIGTASTSAKSSAAPPRPATDQPRRRRVRLVMSFHRRDRILQRHAFIRLDAVA